MPVGQGPLACQGAGGTPAAGTGPAEPADRRADVGHRAHPAGGDRGRAGGSAAAAVPAGRRRRGCHPARWQPRLLRGGGKGVPARDRKPDFPYRAGPHARRCRAGLVVRLSGHGPRHHGGRVCEHAGLLRPVQPGQACRPRRWPGAVLPDHGEVHRLLPADRPAGGLPRDGRVHIRAGRAHPCR